MYIYTHSQRYCIFTMRLIALVETKLKSPPKPININYKIFTWDNLFSSQTTHFSTWKKLYAKEPQ